MEKSIKDSLCKGLRACGIKKEITHQILNEVEKWYDNNGPEWTNARIKDLRQWYETYLTGEPQVPAWFKHGKDQLPLGIWKFVFELPIAKALGVLSLNTVFFEKKTTETQLKKFKKGLAGGKPNPGIVKKACEMVKQITDTGVVYQRKTFKTMPRITCPTIFDMTGASIPCHDCTRTVHPNNMLGEALKALQLSWEDIPQVTFDFLISSEIDALGMIPQDILGNAYALELDGRPHSAYVGRIGVIQQAQLKARIVANPNRVTQVTLYPLQTIYMETARSLDSDCTFNQDDGIKWVQSKLKQGVSLAGSDLTSATDLLDLEQCSRLCDAVYGFNRIEGYSTYEEYFRKVSRSKWRMKKPDGTFEDIQWQHGQPLGTGPSFGLLTLSNNAAAIVAAHIAVSRGELITDNILDEFRVLGDDIIMNAAIEPYYTSMIEALGGEINHSKTLRSNKVAEFAGRVILPDTFYLKAIKYIDPSDSSFMDYMAQLGDQAKFFLKRRQRKVWDTFKYVPGVLVRGSWNPDSYGIPLDQRYHWYLEEVQPALARLAPDLTLHDYSFLLLKAQLGLAEKGSFEHNIDHYDPLLPEGYLPSSVYPAFKVHGDPRLTDGKTKLQWLETPLSGIMDFESWKEVNYPVTPRGGGIVDPNTSSLDEIIQSYTYTGGEGSISPSHKDPCDLDDR